MLQLPPADVRHEYGLQRLRRQVHRRKGLHQQELSVSLRHDRGRELLLSCRAGMLPVQTAEHLLELWRMRRHLQLLPERHQQLHGHRKLRFCDAPLSLPSEHDQGRHERSRR